MKDHQTFKRYVVYGSLFASAEGAFVRLIQNDRVGEVSALFALEFYSWRTDCLCRHL